ncbi:MAG: SDR family NAD(P)-dependent oxidoreductase, partial [Marmoricola sp.]
MSRRVLVTGGASGLGAALAAAFLARGDEVLIGDLNEPAPVVGERATPDWIHLDVRSEDDWAAARDWVTEHWGGLDVLVNNAGVAGGGRIDVAGMDEWQWITEINLFGV